MELPSERYSCPGQCYEEMSSTYPNQIVYAINLEAELDCKIHNIQPWGEIDSPH
jgi:hypothetical protein